MLFDGRDLLKMPAAERRQINGKRIAMIFQDPLSHLNPVYTVGWQIARGDARARRPGGRGRGAARSS